MRVLSLKTKHGTVCIPGDSLHSGHDFFVESNAPPRDVDALFFFDSRGISRSWDTSLLKMLLNHFKDCRFWAISRPLELTTWATLYNFLRSNEMQPKLILTNVGIVDFTPKKQSLCVSMVEQISAGFEGRVSNIQPLGRYDLSSGDSETLYSINYSEEYIVQLRDYFTSKPLIAIKTPVVDPNIPIERKRPSSFFSQLFKTNEFIDRLGCEAVDPGPFDRHLTYDGVHWTPRGNRLVFNALTRHLSKVRR